MGIVSNTGLALIALICVALLVSWRNQTALLSLFNGKSEEKNIHNKYEPAYCLNEDIIMHIQRQQWAKARQEIFGTDQSGFQGEDMEFYRKVFGTVELVLDDNMVKTGRTASSNDTKLHSLVYYRIFKNANDNIRSLMLEYAFQLDNDTIGFKSHNCLRDDCSHRRIYNLPPTSIKGLYFPKNLKRYPFTFIRDPIDRFISAMTEIEYRAQVALSRNQSLPLPLTQPLGSQQRVQEFIQMILSSGASRTLFRDLEALQIEHVAPMIGTLTLASRLEDSPLQIFQLEDLGTEWQRLSQAIRHPRLYEVFARRQPHNEQDNKTWIVHRSSADPHRTSVAARSLFGQVSMQAFQQFGRQGEGQPLPAGVTRDAHALSAKRHLRALCRMYLTDFTCLHYTLPYDCADLVEEVQEAVDYFAFLQSPSSSPGLLVDDWKGLLRALLPRQAMRSLAQLYCLFAASPECAAAFVHGDQVLEGDQERTHEEL